MNVCCTGLLVFAGYCLRIFFIWSKFYKYQLFVWIICFIQDFIEGSADCPLEPSAQSSVASCPAQCPVFQPSAQCSSPVPSVLQTSAQSRLWPSPDCPVQPRCCPVCGYTVPFPHIVFEVFNGCLSTELCYTVVLQSCATELCYCCASLGSRECLSRVFLCFL